MALSRRDTVQKAARLDSRVFRPHASQGRLYFLPLIISTVVGDNKLIKQCHKCQRVYTEFIMCAVVTIGYNVL